MTLAQPEPLDKVKINPLFCQIVYKKDQKIGCQIRWIFVYYPVDWTNTVFFVDVGEKMPEKMVSVRME